MKKLLAYILGIFLLGSCSPHSAGKVDLKTPQPVKDFTLTDQNGNAFTFSSQKGKVILVSFLFTHCPDVCSFEALKIAKALELLGPEASKVAILAVTVDPERDTVALNKAYGEALGIDGKWTFLTGPAKDLEPVWKDFNIAVAKGDDHDQTETAHNAKDLGIPVTKQAKAMELPTQGLTVEEVAKGHDVIGKFSGGYDMAHAVPFVFVDKQGNRRSALGPGVTPQDLVKEIRSLLN